MKLLTKTSLLFVSACLLVFAGGGIIFQRELNQIFNEESDEILLQEKSEVLAYISKHDTLPVNELPIGDRLSFRRVEAEINETFKDTLIYNTAEEEMHPYRQLSFTVKTRSAVYLASIYSPSLEEEDLTETIVTAFVYLTLLLLVTILVLTILLSRRLWKPFYKTIGALQQYDVNSTSVPEFSKTGTQEFNQLHDAIGKMMNTISRHYQDLRSFTENAAHELQTPLAVLQSSAELLLQGENLSAGQYEELSRMLATVKRMSRLNQALLLLSKIENRQYDNSSKTSLTVLLRKKEDYFRELAAHKNLKLEAAISEGIETAIHPELADILVSNLLTNALRHSPAGSTIVIQLRAGELRISNSGDKAIQAPEKLFERFYKENQSAESTGLGLAIVKQITESAGMTIHYSFEENHHSFTVRF